MVKEEIFMSLLYIFFIFIHENCISRDLRVSSHSCCLVFRVNSRILIRYAREGLLRILFKFSKKISLQKTLIFSWLNKNEKVKKSPRWIFSKRVCVSHRNAIFKPENLPSIYFFGMFIFDHSRLIDTKNEFENLKTKSNLMFAKLCTKRSKRNKFFKYAPFIKMCEWEWQKLFWTLFFFFFFRLSYQIKSTSKYKILRV